MRLNLDDFRRAARRPLPREVFGLISVSELDLTAIRVLDGFAGSAARECLLAEDDQRGVVLRRVDP